MNDCRIILKQKNPSEGSDARSSQKARTANPSATTMLAVAHWQMSCLWTDLNTRKQHVENISQMYGKNIWGFCERSNQKKTRSAHPFEGARYWLGCSRSTLPCHLSERLHSRGWQTFERQTFERHFLAVRLYSWHNSKEHAEPADTWTVQQLHAELNQTRDMIRWHRAPKPKLFYWDITKAKLVSFTYIGHVSCLYSMGIEYCETDFRLNGGRPVNKIAPAAVLWKSFIEGWTYVHFCKRLLNFWTWVYSILWRHPFLFKQVAVWGHALSCDFVPHN